MTIENYSIAGAKDLVSSISNTVLFINSGACAELEEIQDELLLHIQDKLERLEMHLTILESPEYAEAVKAKEQNSNLQAVAS